MAIEIVQKLCNYCNVLHDDEMSCGDYVKQLTYLLLLKMAEERTTNRYESGLTSCEEKPDGRCHTYSYDDVLPHHKSSLDIFWPKDDS